MSEKLQKSDIFTSPLLTGRFEVLDVCYATNTATIKNLDPEGTKTGQRVQLEVNTDFLESHCTKSNATKVEPSADDILEKVSDNVAGMLLEIHKVGDDLEEGKVIPAHRRIVELFNNNKNLLDATGSINQDFLAKSLLDSWKSGGEFVPNFAKK